MTLDSIRSRLGEHSAARQRFMDMLERASQPGQFAAPNQPQDQMFGQLGGEVMFEDGDAEVPEDAVGTYIPTAQPAMSFGGGGGGEGGGAGGPQDPSMPSGMGITPLQAWREMTGSRPGIDPLPWQMNFGTRGLPGTRGMDDMMGARGGGGGTGRGGGDRFDRPGGGGAQARGAQFQFGGGNPNKMIMGGGIGGGEIMRLGDWQRMNRDVQASGDEMMRNAPLQAPATGPGFVNQPPIKISPRSRVGRGPVDQQGNPTNQTATGQVAASPSDVVMPSAQQPVMIPPASQFGGVGGQQLPPGMSSFRGQVMPSSQMPGAQPSQQTIPSYPGTPQGAAQPGMGGSLGGAAIGGLMGGALGGMGGALGGAMGGLGGMGDIGGFGMGDYGLGLMGGMMGGGFGGGFGGGGGGWGGGGGGGAEGLDW